MFVELVSGPESPLLSLDDAKAQLRIDPAFDLDDTYLESLIAAATSYIDGRDGILGRALVTQSWRGVIDGCFPGEIIVPLPPLQSVSSITYYDPEGVLKTLDPAEYDVIPGRDNGLIVPAYGKSWPAVQNRRRAAIVEFVAGFGAPSDVPADIRHMALFLVSHWYMQRVPVAVGQAANRVPETFDALFNKARVWGF